MDTDKKLTIVLPKIPDIELVAVEGLQIMGKYFGVDHEKIAEAGLVVTEAVINAFEHAGNENSDVTIEFAMTKEKLTILVKDSGTGFKPETVAEPLIQNKISSDHKRGWGLKLMKSMSDDLVIESGNTGTRITMIKKLV